MNKLSIELRKLVSEEITFSHLSSVIGERSLTINYNGRKAGTIVISKPPNIMVDDTIEITDIDFDEEYENLNVFTQLTKQLWNIFPKAIKIIVDIPTISQPLWEKLGFIRLNDTYHILIKGH